MDSRAQGKEIIEYYLRELEEDGITYVPRWSPSTSIIQPVVAVTPPAPPTTAPIAIAAPAESGKDTAACKDNSSPVGSANEPLAATPDGDQECFKTSIMMIKILLMYI